MSGLSNSEYVHSGKLGLGPALIPLAGVPGAIGLSILYAYISVYSPVTGYISVVFTAGLAFGLGLLITLTARMAKCRNIAFVRVAALLCGLFTVYTSWVAFDYVLLSRSTQLTAATMVNLFFTPGAVWDMASELSKTGWYSVFNITPSGPLIWALWVLEALIIVVGTIYLATSSIEAEVFCEKCDKWCDSALDVVRLEQPDDREQVISLHAGGISSFEHLKRADVETFPSYSIDTWRCTTCKQTAAMQARLVTTVTNDQGELEESGQLITPIVLVSPVQLSRVTAR